MTAKGKIFSIVRSSLHDGAGIRTVIYFKGCSLRCQWCHNPEGISPSDEIMYYPDKCIGCGRCAEVCPAHRSGGRYLREGCTACGKCAAVCPNGATVKCGREYSSDELYDIIARDRHYYDLSGGGATFSGGECFLQPELLRELALKCRENGINTAAESALCFESSRLDIAVGLIDELFVDLKHMDTDRHKIYTGQGNSLILANIRALSERHANITVRIPLIPGVNDGEENLAASARFLNSCGEGVKRLELLRYNDLAAGKYDNLGLHRLFSAETQTDSAFESKRAFLRSMTAERIDVI